MASKRQLKPKKCRWCKEAFKPWNSLQAACGPRCALSLERKKKQDRLDKEAKLLKQKVNANDKEKRRKAAVRAFNRFIRLRDRGNPCISCGKPSIGDAAGKFDAGHYIPAGNCTALRFDERNVNLQCHWNCNIQQSGNRTEYRKGLIEKYGQEVVDFLEGPQPTIDITVDWYREIEKTYKAKCKEMESRNE